MSVGSTTSKNLSEALSFSRLMAVDVSKKAMPLSWQWTMMASRRKRLASASTK